MTAMESPPPPSILRQPNDSVEIVTSSEGPRFHPAGWTTESTMKIIATFCLCDDLLKAIGHHESSFPQHLNDAEVMTIALVAASCFQGRHDLARFMLAQHGYIPGRISKSRFNRRLHRLKETVASVARLDSLRYTTIASPRIEASYIR